MPTISITSREDTNNRSMLAPAQKPVDGVSLRPISLGSLEILRQLGNALATGSAELDAIDTKTLTEFIWVHAAPQDEVVDTVYNHPSQVACKATLFAMSISPAMLREVTSSFAADQASVRAASATAIPDPDLPDSPNAPTPH